MTLTTDRRSTAISASAPSTPRLRLESTGARHTLRLVAPVHKPRCRAAGSSPGYRRVSGADHRTGPKRRRLGRAPPSARPGWARSSAGLLHQSIDVPAHRAVRRQRRPRRLAGRPPGHQRRHRRRGNGSRGHHQQPRTSPGHTSRRHGSYSRHRHRIRRCLGNRRWSSRDHEQSLRTVNRKNPGRTLMEKRAAKRAKNANNSVPVIIPPTGR
jgi:hypothetical protein